MDESKLEKIRELFRVCADMADGERETFLETVCSDDTTIRGEVERLIAERAVTPTVETHPTTSIASMPQPGDRIGPYRLERKLGEGGMGLVFEAIQDQPIRRRVALKVIKPGMDSAQVLARFDAERQALALMNNPNVAKVLDAGTTDRGQPYFVMEHVAGLPLNEYCDRHKLDVGERLDLFIQACRGVHHAHQKGVIHRDLKPSNILVQIREDKAEVKIIDFGIARAVARELTEMTLFTEHGQMVGTPEYMSPEQAEMSNLDIDTRTDVYSLGVVLYEMLIGRLPFDITELRRGGLLEIRRRIRDEEPHKPSTHLTGQGQTTTDVARYRRTDPVGLERLVRGDLDWITMKALEKDRTRRYESVSDLAADIVRFLSDEPVTAGPPSASYRARKFVRRNRFAMSVSAIVAASLVFGLTVATVGFVRAVRAERVARLEARTSAEVIDFMVGLFEISDPDEARGRSVTAKEILDRGVDSIQDELGEQPAVKARLLGVMAVVFRSLGLHEDARRLFDAAIRNQRREFGAESPEVAEAMTALGGLLLMQRKPDEARPILEESLEILEAGGAEDDMRLAKTLNNLGLAARLEGRRQEALAYYERALRVREAAEGPKSVEVAWQLLNIGSLQRRLGETDSALATYGRALDIVNAELPFDHPRRAMLLHNIGSLHRSAERYALASDYLEQALEIRTKTLPPGHEHRISSTVGLGLALAGLRQDARARELLEQAVSIGERELKTGHSLVTMALETLSGVLRRMGEPEAADRVEARLRKLRGADG